VLHLEGELELLRREARLSPDVEPVPRLSVED